ncbi:RNA polymerase sigma factor [Salinispirillum marinum]|uniref:RNA polymerase sigma factor n=2 Tax=Saccharospirillaceae TaxID=255527 RepID=A0ABV8BCE5_9GAMM
MSITDAALIERVVKRQDRHAYSQLVLRHQSTVRQWTRRLCNGDEALGDDLAQETFIKAYAALPAFRGDGKLSTWLYRIAFNLAASQWRRQQPEWVDWDVMVENEQEGDDNALTMADQLTQTRDLTRAMKQLSAPQQWAIELCFADGFSHREVADIMGVPVGTVKTHILRGKQTLSRLLATWGHEA